MKQNYLIYGHALLIGDTVCHKVYSGLWGRIETHERFYPAKDTYVYCQSTDEYVSILDAFWNSYYKRWFYIDEDTIRVNTPKVVLVYHTIVVLGIGVAVVFSILLR